MEQEEYWTVEKQELTPKGKPFEPWREKTFQRYTEDQARRRIAQERETETRLQQNHPYLRPTVFRLIKVTREVINEEAVRTIDCVDARAWDSI